MKLTETTARFANNPGYVRYEGMLIQGIAAVATGDEETADRLRDEMEEPESRLSSAEILRLNGLSGDLYSLYDQELLEAFKGTPQEYAIAFREAYKQNDYVEVLNLLRKEQMLFDKGQVAHTRFRMYWELHHANPAMLFLKLAMNLAPNHPEYGWQYFVHLQMLGRFHEIEMLSREIVADDNATPELKIEAGTSLHSIARNSFGEDASRLNELALSGILEGMNKLEGRGRLAGNINVKAEGYTVLGSIYYSLGRKDEALVSLGRAIKEDPNQADAYEMRGLLFLEEDRERSKQDLVKAVELNSQSPSVYIALCRISLIDAILNEGDLNECIGYAEHLRLIAKDPVDKAQCFEYVALAHMVLFGPSDFVRQGFEFAASLDPLNLALAENLTKYQELEQAVVFSEPSSYVNQFDMNFTNDVFHPPLRMAV